MDLFDSDGYKLVPKKFNSGGYTYTFVKDLDSDWKIYSAYSPTANKIIDYELVKFTKSEEYIIAGNKVPKKWSYPTANAFGRNGFSCGTIENCESKYNKLLTKERPVDYMFDIPRNKNFSICELSENLGVPYSKIYTRLKELGKEIQIVHEIKNKKGRATKIYCRK